MAKGELPTPEELRQLLRYEPETGKLYWLERPPEMFSDEPHCKAWNTRNAGKEAFTAKDRYGYQRGSIRRNNISAHRAIWALIHGAWPPEQIDHINGVKDDNRPCNLRCATAAENHRNRPRRKDNTSGRTGVLFEKRTGNWFAQIRVHGRHIHLGTFERFEDAVAARERAEIEHGYHANHDRTGS